MAWWKKALIVSVVWVALTIAAGMIHTDVVLADRITPERSDQISETYGMACGVGLVAIWLVAYSRHKQANRSG
jgi:hypothetical protein